MTNPTSNYGFVLPTSTDLVTDLPADFDVALQGVDTRLKALQPGTTLGDIAYSSATANTNTRLPIGTSGQVLAVSGGGVPAWTTTADVTPLTTKGDLFTFDTADARLGVGTNGQTLVADSSTATGLKWATPAGGGKILQTVFGSSVNLVNNTTSTYVTTGATATITPSATTSKIIVLASINGLYWDSGTTSLDFKLVRGATALAAITRVQEGMANATSTSSVNFTYQDSPSTTSATTYDVTYATTTPTGRARVGHPATGSTHSIQSMILMEVGV